MVNSVHGNIGVPSWLTTRTGLRPTRSERLPRKGPATSCPSANTDTSIPTARGIAPAIDLEPAAELWSAWTQAAYAASYVDAVAGTRLVPSSPDDVALLLQVFTLHKAIYEHIMRVSGQ